MYVAMTYKNTSLSFQTLRASTSASYSPDIDADAIDYTKDSIRKIPASKRSETQAFWLVQQWLEKATTTEPAPKRRRT